MVFLKPTLGYLISKEEKKAHENKNRHMFGSEAVFRAF